MHGTYSEDAKSLITPIHMTIFLLLYLLFSRVSEQQYINSQENLQNTSNKQQEIHRDDESNKALKAGAINHIIRQGMKP